MRKIWIIGGIAYALLMGLTIKHHLDNEVDIWDTAQAMLWLTLTIAVFGAIAYGIYWFFKAQSTNKKNLASIAESLAKK